MKNTLTFILLLISLGVQAQEVISQTQEVIIQDTLYFLKEVTVRDNGTDYPDTLVNKYLLGDSTTTATLLFDLAIQPWVKVAEGMQASLQRNRAQQQFNAVNTHFQSVANRTLFEESSMRFFQHYQGRYRVILSDGSNFLAEVVQLPSGRLRLHRESDGFRWPLNPLGPHAFRLIGFDHNSDASGDNFDMYWDGVSAERKIFWPAERLSGTTGGFRIVKVQ